MARAIDNADVLWPGEYARLNGIWHACSPNGLLANLGGHNVTEHPDGTITVSPSIEVTNRTNYWHGHLQAGVWSTLASVGSF
jgi:hypothetical protein